MKEELNIDELLNSFIDGELTERQKTEAQRLISHNPEIEKRYQQLQKCRMLVACLPCDEAPADTAEQVRATLERKALLAEQHIAISERKGTRQLMLRKVLTAAAMIGLVAVLGVVVYTIITPDSAQPAMAFKGRLELKTKNPLLTNAVIDKIIRDNGLSDSATAKRQDDKKIYTLTCGRENLSTFLAKLGGSWERFDSATLYVETQTPQEHVIVTDVDAKQIVDLITPPKPRLTGEERTTEGLLTPSRDEKKVRLTIVVAASQTDN